MELNESGLLVALGVDDSDKMGTWGAVARILRITEVYETVAIPNTRKLFDREAAGGKRRRGLHASSILGAGLHDGSIGDCIVRRGFNSPRNIGELI